MSDHESEEVRTGTGWNVVAGCLRPVRIYGGETRIRTWEAIATDLQSAPFGHSGIPPLSTFCDPCRPHRIHRTSRTGHCSPVRRCSGRQYLGNEDIALVLLPLCPFLWLGGASPDD